MRYILFLILCFLTANYSHAQADTTGSLYKVLKTQDSLLFNVGYNTCDMSQFETLLSDSFKFYHDKAGITGSKTEFISGIRDGLCKMNYKAVRKLVAGSLEVYPMEKKGILYGAVQSGRHSFYALETGKPESLTGEAKFTHLWLLEDGRWRLVMSLSYDHR